MDAAISKKVQNGLAILSALEKANKENATPGEYPCLT
jgi:hypothetical protein